MHECRHHRLGIELDMVWIELISFQNVDVVAFPLDAFFREHEPNLGCTHRRSMMIKLDHAASPRRIIIFARSAQASMGAGLFNADD
jgi:hypothetical protein